MKLRKFLVRIGILDFKIGDRVKPNPKVFKSDYQIVDNQGYAVIKYYDGWTIRVEGSNIPFTKLELILY